MTKNKSEARTKMATELDTAFNRYQYAAVYGIDYDAQFQPNLARYVIIYSIILMGGGEIIEHCILLFCGNRTDTLFRSNGSDAIYYRGKTALLF